MIEERRQGREARQDQLGAAAHETLRRGMQGQLGGAAAGRHQTAWRAVLGSMPKHVREQQVLATALQCSAPPGTAGRSPSPHPCLATLLTLLLSIQNEQLATLQPHLEQQAIHHHHTPALQPC